MQMYKSAIVNEIGHVMFWCDELCGEKRSGYSTGFPAQHDGR